MHLNDLSPQNDLTLWTGGWDSTYRVLQRAVVEARPVRPVYVVDRERGSSYMEVRAINGVLLDLEERRPDAYARVEPPRYIDRRAIPPDPEITEAWEALRGAGHRLGNQYEWLPRLARAAGWTGVELSIKGSGGIASAFGPHVSRASAGAPAELAPDAPAEVQVLLERFALPFWGRSKSALQAHAAREGLSDILDAHTWFCFRPQGGRPCGECNPCRYVLNDGLDHLVPLRRRLRARAKEAVADVRFRLGLRTRVRSLLDRGLRHSLPAP
jgi:hypothetical protein